MIFWQSSGLFDHVIMGVTFNVIIITHVTMCYCCEALRKTKLKDMDAAIDEFGRTNP